MTHTPLPMIVATFVALTLAIPAGATEAGKPAPLFAVASSTGKIALADYQGKGTPCWLSPSPASPAAERPR